MRAHTHCAEGGRGVQPGTAQHPVSSYQWNICAGDTRKGGGAAGEGRSGVARGAVEGGEGLPAPAWMQGSTSGGVSVHSQSREALGMQKMPPETAVAVRLNCSPSWLHCQGVSTQISLAPPCLAASELVAKILTVLPGSCWICFLQPWEVSLPSVLIVDLGWLVLMVSTFVQIKAQGSPLTKLDVSESLWGC